jgi:hypothetical protein
VSIADSTKRKPSKPYQEFPLFAQNSQQWCRKIRSKFDSFDAWEDSTAGLKKQCHEYAHLNGWISQETDLSAAIEHTLEARDLNGC